MISSFAHNLILKILIPIQFCSLFKSRAYSLSLFVLLLLFIIFPQFQFHSCYSSSSSSPSHSSESIDNNNNNEKKIRNLKIKLMKIHPLPKKRNNATIQYAAIQNRQQPFPGGGGGGGNGTNHKKLRRLPHIFSRVLELPFKSDADVSIQESPDCFKFVVETDGMRDVRAHAIQIHPGVTKIVVRVDGSSSPRVSSLSELELDMWRFRLPESTLPELASASYEDGVLTVTVPKGAEETGGDGNANRQFRGGMENTNNNNNNRLVLVQ